MIEPSAATSKEGESAQVSVEYTQLSPDGRTGVRLEDTNVSILDLATGATIKQFRVAIPTRCDGASVAAITDATFSADGQWIAAVSRLAGLAVWNTVSGQRTFTLDYVEPPDTRFDWTFVQATQLGYDSVRHDRLVRVEIDVRNISREDQALNKWNSFACLWVGDKPYNSRGFIILVDMSRTDSMAQLLRSGLKTGETAHIEVTVDAGVTLLRTVARAAFFESSWSWHIDTGKSVRIGLLSPLRSFERAARSSSQPGLVKE
ncbi:MAG: hypothetical protein ACT4OZ_12960 [Gemmatimonadota bacterium]